VTTPVDPSLGVQRTTPDPFQVVGAAGVAVYSGYLNQEEKDPALAGRQRFVTYSDVLANVAIVASGVRYFLNLIAKAEWKAVPADDSKEAQKYADLTQSILDDMRTPWHRVVRKAALYKFYGFSILEWTAKRRPDGAIGFLDVQARSQQSIERWDMATDGSVLGVVQRSPQTQQEIYLPRGKVIHLVDDSIHDSPEGVGLFRHLVKDAKALERFEILEGWGYETDLRGIPIGRGPLAELEKMVKAGTLSADQAAKLRAPLDAFIRQHVRNPNLGLLLDSSPHRAAGEQQTPSQTKQWDVELLKGEGSPHQFVAAAIERKTRSIARVLGVEHLLLGSNDRGSYALSVDKSQAFGMTVESGLREVREAMRQDLLTPLWALNGWPEEMKPTLKTDQAQYRDIQQVTGALADVAKAGAPLSPDDEAIGEVRDLLGLSRPPKVNLTLRAQAQAQAAARPQNPKNPQQQPQ